MKGPIVSDYEIKIYGFSAHVLDGKSYRISSVTETSLTRGSGTVRSKQASSSGVAGRREFRNTPRRGGKFHLQNTDAIFFVATLKPEVHFSQRMSLAWVGKELRRGSGRRIVPW